MQYVYIITNNQQGFRDEDSQNRTLSPSDVESCRCGSQLGDDLDEDSWGGKADAAWPFNMGL